MKINKALSKLWDHSGIKKIKGISTDSRTIKSGELFVPLSGDNFNGHKFIKAALKRGAKLYLYSEEEYKGPKGIKVEDTLEAYCLIALEYRKAVDCTVVGITGSTGKTTTKNLLHDILDSAGKKVHSTYSNENNMIGVPKTILAMPEDTQYLILEMGTNHFGEIEAETMASSPDVGMIVNIGPSHLEFFGDLQGIYREKTTLLREVLKKEGKVFVPNDPMFEEFFGLDNVFTVDGEIRGGKLFMELPFEFSMSLSSVTAFYHHNILFAAAAAIGFGIDGKDVEDAILSHRFIRMSEFEWNGKTVIDDSYNANPVSYEKALRYLFSLKGRKALVIGRMLEMGDSEKIYEQEIFSFIESNTPSLVIAKGSFATDIPNDWIRAKKQAKILDILKKRSDEYDIVFLKGSHGTEVYKVAKLMEKEI
ncbi:UDP-N-acetylmuramoyl-tripeptide--D-alanyl-D-alanine ligase [bacterium]|nr:UDP-N-acetylmuramoyl-tripeptide--D-alanyl-D-alanine ligase [bacterium]